MSNNKYKVLVVEDDRNIINMIQAVLDSNGYRNFFIFAPPPQPISSTSVFGCVVI